ncbi:unnamed protein product, partial [Cladocopium goreaui]
MANTANGFVAEGEAYDKIVYVSKVRLQELKKKMNGKSKGADITSEDVKGLMYPDDLDDESVLIPVDVTGEECPTSYEDLIEKVGALGAVKAMVNAADFFEKNKKKFSTEQLPLPMTVGEWMSFLSTEEGLDEEGGEEEDCEEDEVYGAARRLQDTKGLGLLGWISSDGPTPVDLDKIYLAPQRIHGVMPVSFQVFLMPEGPEGCQPTDCQPTATGIYAGVTISRVEIIIDPDSFNAPGAKLRVVFDSVDRAGANAGQCRYGNFAYGAHSAIVNQPWSGVGASTITQGITAGSLQAKVDQQTFIPLTFKMGGIYHICYSDDGSFAPAHTDIVPQRIE